MRGYVKHVSKVGLFVSLSTDLDARVRLSNLADTFVEEPGKAFPAGRLVKGRILSIAGDRQDCLEALPTLFPIQACMPLQCPACTLVAKVKGRFDENISGIVS